MQNFSQNVTINKPAPNVLQAGKTSGRSTNSVKVLKAKVTKTHLPAQHLYSSWNWVSVQGSKNWNDGATRRSKRVL